MELLHPSYQIETPLPQLSTALERIELAGRTCYKSEERIEPGSDVGFARMILARGHESVIEHEFVTVRFICDRGVTHELVRHRLAAYSQESTRYCNYGSDDVKFIIPIWLRGKLRPGKFEIAEFGAEKDREVSLWTGQMLSAERCYQELLVEGWRPEQARGVLPNALKTEIVATMNLRQWKHVFRLRCSSDAHPQMRELMIPLRDELRSRIPVVFD